MSRHQERREKLRQLLPEQEVDALLVTNEANVTYLTGFTGDSSFLLLAANEEVLLTDGRYTVQLAEECPDLPLAIRQPGTKMIDWTHTVLQEYPQKRLAFEAGDLTVAAHSALSQKVDSTQWIATGGLVERLREIKDEGEIAEIRQAIRYAEQAFAVVRHSLRPSRTEREVAHEIEQQIRLFGGDKCSFPPIVAVGERAALPHATPTDRKIGDDRFVLIDWGARGRLYCSDLTRVLVTAKIPPKLQAIYEVVLTAQQAAIDAIRPGAVMSDVDAVARDSITAAGYGEEFNHGLGHGIGLQVHESPRLAANEDRELSPGMVVTVEPGVYIAGWGGVRIEDDVLVTEGGREVLTSVPKQFDESIVA